MVILIPTFREQVVNSISSIDIAKFLHSIGHIPVVYMINPNANTGAIGKELSQVNYDAVLCSNYLRDDFMGIIKENVPFITFIQDICDNIHVAGKSGTWNNNPNNWIIGYADTAIKWGYDKSRLIQAPYYVSPEKFIPQEGKKVYRVSCISNRGADLNSRKLDAIRAGIPHNAFDRAEKILTDYYSSPNVFPLSDMKKMKRLFRREKHIKDLPDGLFWIYIYCGIGESVYRKIELCKYAEQNKHRRNALAIYGAEWDKDNDLKEYAKGYAKHGLPLCEAYGRSKYTVILKQDAMGYHHKIVECLFSGGCPTMRSDKKALPSKIFNRNEFVSKQNEYWKYMMERILNHAPYSYLMEKYIYSYLVDLKCYCRTYNDIRKIY